MSVTVLSTSAVRLDWKHPGNYKISTIIDRKSNNNADYDAITRVYGTSFTDSTLSPGGSYTYRVRAAIDDRTSDPSHNIKIRWLDQGTLLWENNFPAYMRKVRFTHQEKSLIAGGMDGTLKAYDGINGNVLWSVNIPGAIEDIDISPDDKCIAVGTSETAASGTYNIVAVYNLSDGIQLWQETYNRQMITVKFSPDGNSLATGSYDNHVRLHQSSNGTLLWEEYNSSYVNMVDISPDQAFVVTGSWDYYLRVRNYSTGTLVWESLNNREVWDVKVFPNNTLIAAGDLTGAVKVWNAVTGSLLWTSSNTGFFNLNVHPGGTSVLSSHREDLNCYHAETGQIMWSYPKSGFCGFNHSGNRTALVSNNGTLIVFNSSTGDSLWTGHHDDYVGSFSYSGDDLLIATGGADQIIRVWAAKNAWVHANVFGE